MYHQMHHQMHRMQVALLNLPHDTLDCLITTEAAVSAYGHWEIVSRSSVTPEDRQLLHDQLDAARFLAEKLLSGDFYREFEGMVNMELPARLARAVDTVLNSPNRLSILYGTDEDSTGTIFLRGTTPRTFTNPEASPFVPLIKDLLGKLEIHHYRLAKCKAPAADETETCGRFFLKSHNKSKYCCDECRTRARRAANRRNQRAYRTYYFR